MGADKQTDKQTDMLTDNKGHSELSGVREPTDRQTEWNDNKATLCEHDAIKSG